MKSASNVYTCSSVLQLQSISITRWN